MAEERVSFEEMTDAQKQAAFLKWVKSREERKGKSEIRRKATRTLISKYQDEFDALVKAGGTAPRTRQG